MGEHVDGDDLLESIDPVSAENVQIPRQRGWVARDVDHLCWANLAELLQCCRCTTPAGWVENDAGILGIKLSQEAGEQILRASLDKLAVVSTKLCCVFTGGLYGALVVFHPGIALGQASQLDCKEANTAVGVDQVFRAVGLKYLAHRLDHAWQHEIVGLEKGMIRYDPVLGGDPQINLDTTSLGRVGADFQDLGVCLLYTSPSPRDRG